MRSYLAESSVLLSLHVADNSDFRYEPASTIKVLHLLYSTRESRSQQYARICITGSMETIRTVTFVRWKLSKTANKQQTTIQNAFNNMMQESNVFTDAFTLKWGLPVVQSLACSLGMSSTHLN